MNTTVESIEGLRAALENCRLYLATANAALQGKHERANLFEARIAAARRLIGFSEPSADMEAIDRALTGGTQ